MEIFQIPGGNKRWSLSLVKLKSFPAFLKMNSTSDIYSEFSKIFGATISRRRFYLSISQEITVYWCDWVLLSCEINMTLEKEVFSEVFREVFSEAWDQNALHCLSEKGYYSIVCIASVRYVQAEDCNTRLHETLSTW